MKGFPEAINAAFPQTLVQTCIVHLLRNALACVAWQDRRQWDQAIPFFAFPAEVRRIIYTINAIESLKNTRRTAVRSRGHFPIGEAAIKLLYLVVRRVSKDWKMPQREWTAAITHFAIMFGDRFSAEWRDRVKPTPHTR